MLPLVLLSLDGWGHSEATRGNAIAASGAPAMKALTARWPHTLLEASGRAVGLPDGQMGNSEVGHTCMGAGRTVLQDLLRLSEAARGDGMRENPVLRPAMEGVARRGGALHLMGLTSDGGVHSHIEHAKGLLAAARDLGVREIYWHAFLDGRDTAPRCALGYIEALEACFRELKAGSFATVIGRYYAMDRDNRWDRTERAWRAMVLGEGIPAASAAEAVRAGYERGEGDEFVQPTVVARPAGAARDARVRDGDAIVFFNFRADRARQMTRAFTQEPFTGFARPSRPALTAYVCMTRYDATFDLPVAFPPAIPRLVLGEVLSVAGLSQLRLAETEKYAHVTFFFNGGEERVFPKEERLLIPSPKVRTYDLQPEMSAEPLTQALLDRLARGAKDLVAIVNFANADMVGHTGSFEATVEACRVTDRCVGRIAGAVLDSGGSLIVTADHGNAEQMIDPVTGGPHTAHTTNPVPVILASPSPLVTREGSLRSGGTLADVAPSILRILGLEQPGEMTGRSLLL